MKAFIFDTETSGLIRNRTVPLDKQPEIIELAAATIDMPTGEVLSTHNLLIKPVRGISEEITRITGITSDDLKDCQPFSVHAPAIRQSLEMADCAIAHNLSFDKEMMDIEFERLGINLQWPDRLICTVEATVHLKGFRLKLQELHELLCNEQFKEAHRAMNDTQALIRCAIKLYEMEAI